MNDKHLHSAPIREPRPLDVLDVGHTLRVWGVGFRVWGLGVRVESFEF